MTDTATRSSLVSALWSLAIGTLVGGCSGESTAASRTETDEPWRSSSDSTITDAGPGTSKDAAQPTNSSSSTPVNISEPAEPNEPTRGVSEPTSEPGVDEAPASEPQEIALPCSTEQVQTLFTSDCGGSGCHEGSEPIATLNLVQPAFETRTVDVAAASCEDWTLITPGSPELSFLYQKVAADRPTCGLPMPVGKRWSTGQIECLASWIRGLTGDEPPPTCETCETTLCIDLQTDPRHCGGCDNTCIDGQVCTDGACQGCPAELTACGGECIDLTSDSNHCGACDNACGGGQSCVDSGCSCSSSGALSLAQDVQPIFDASCGGNACHSGRHPAASLDLSRGQAFDGLVGVPATQCDGRWLVAPGQPDQSYLMDKLLGTRMCSGTIMPKGSLQISREELDLIGGWICGGAAP